MFDISGFYCDHCDKKTGKVPDSCVAFVNNVTSPDYVKRLNKSIGFHSKQN